jgi:D-glycero-D-manno-heptose 1,7-bisphosphate phosphatase
LAVGDSLRDLQAVLVTGARPVPVRTGNGGEALNSGLLPAGTPAFDNLAAVAAELDRDR